MSKREKARRRPPSRVVIEKVTLGRVLHVVKTGHVLVKPDPRLRISQDILGSQVVRDGEEVGRILDVIGSVRAPYIVVKASTREAESLGPGMTLQVLIKRVVKPRRPATRRKRPQGRGRLGRQRGRR